MGVCALRRTTSTKRCCYKNCIDYKIHAQGRSKAFNIIELMKPVMHKLDLTKTPEILELKKNLVCLLSLEACGRTKRMQDYRLADGTVIGIGETASGTDRDTKIHTHLNTNYQQSYDLAIYRLQADFGIME